MNKIALSIKNRLSLRQPQANSLEILAELADQLTLSKTADLPVEIEKVKTRYPMCTDFERDFPSLCFALATGVGKTRLMGAFIAYLHLAKGIRNFFVLSPNLTIYDKLITDLSEPNHPKYVFSGIGEFVHHPPRIINGDNYKDFRQRDMFDTPEINISLFNISKINAETRSGTVPRIKKMSEVLGEPYFNYLSNLDDLVLLMDESHHYRADRGMQVINELRPVLGLELTATPQVERGGNAIKFKNVVYEYSLAKAIRDGFVKEPAVATRKDFDPQPYSAEELDRIKLEDGIRLHEDTKVALDIYSRDVKTRQVKPFVLVVAKDTQHATQLKDLIVSTSFFEGYYADKVMEIHSNQKGGEKEENIAQLLCLENPENAIEIVIHVNMLKEGWDVTNLYTIIPLRSAASQTLREQTIGRGLRLPYGKRTDCDKVDKLTIVAHDRFQEIVDEANKPDSIIRKENIIEIDPCELQQQKEVLTVVSSLDQKLRDEETRIESLTLPEEIQEARINLEVQKSILSTLPELNTTVVRVQDLTRPEIKAIAVERIRQKIYSSPQQSLFAEQMIKEVEDAYETMVSDFAANIIEIPRIIIQQSDKIRSGFHDFDLDVKNLNLQPGSEQIVVIKLTDGKCEIIEPTGRKIKYGSLENVIVNELINYPEIDYDSNADLLFKLSRQAIEKLRTYLDEDGTSHVVVNYKAEIGRFIYIQMMEHFYCEMPEFRKPVVKPFTRIEEHNYSKYSKDSIHHHSETITPAHTIPSKVFSGFKKACHNLYKFDSKTEKDFSGILEMDKAVVKWLRPAANQFHIYWKHNSRQYRPDFVAETVDAIYLIETKKEGDMDAAEVWEKSQAALAYCRHASEFTSQHGGKPWKYILIPHDTVKMNMGFDTLVKNYDNFSKHHTGPM